MISSKLKEPTFKPFGQSTSKSCSITPNVIKIPDLL